MANDRVKDNRFHPFRPTQMMSMVRLRLKITTKQAMIWPEESLSPLERRMITLDGNRLVFCSLDILPFVDLVLFGRGLVQAMGPRAFSAFHIWGAKRYWPKLNRVEERGERYLDWKNRSSYHPPSDRNGIVAHTYPIYWFGSRRCIRRKWYLQNGQYDTRMQYQTFPSPEYARGLQWYTPSHIIRTDDAGLSTTHQTESNRCTQPSRVRLRLKITTKKVLFLMWYDQSKSTFSQWCMMDVNLLRFVCMPCIPCAGAAEAELATAKSAIIIEF